MIIEDAIFRLAGVSHHAGEANDGCRASLMNLLGKAKFTIRIVAGELNPEFYCDRATLEAVGEKVVIEIIVGPDPNAESMQCLASLPNDVSVYQLSDWPAPHFAVIDNKHMRLEEPHAPDQSWREDYIIDDFKYAERWSKTFDELKDQAELKDLTEFLEVA